MKLLIARDAQSRMLALVHCKKHNLLNHYNVVCTALRKLTLKFIASLRKFALNYIVNYYPVSMSLFCLSHSFVCLFYFCPN